MVSVIYLFIALQLFGEIKLLHMSTHFRPSSRSLGSRADKLREYKINRKLLSGRRSSLITASILSEVSNRTTFQISRPSLRDSYEKVYTPSLDADKSNSLIPLNVSTSAWNCFFFSFLNESSRARKYQGSCIGKVGVYQRHVTDSFLIAGNT